MEQNITIALDRQCGSGGDEIGKVLSEKLGVPFYGKEILAEAEKGCHLEKALFETFDERIINSPLYSMAMASRLGKKKIDDSNVPVYELVFLEEYRAIQRLAAEKACVFVGRCADYALRDRKDCFRVFIYAPLDDRIDQVAQARSISVQEARDLIKKTDKERNAYYNYYTGQKWGDNSNYDLCINSGLYGVRGAAELIASAQLW